MLSDEENNLEIEWNYFKEILLSTSIFLFLF